MEVRQVDRVGEMEMNVEGEEEGFPITTLAGDLSQTALPGLLRQLYSLGLPIISVVD
jgi:hypothetical protein